MSTQSHWVHTLHCDGPKCDGDEPYENSRGEVYFESEDDARSHAERNGWRNFDGKDWCKDCKPDPHPFKGDDRQVCRICDVHLSEHDNPENIPVVLPGQLPLIEVGK